MNRLEEDRSAVSAYELFIFLSEIKQEREQMVRQMCDISWWRRNDKDFTAKLDGPSQRLTVLFHRIFSTTMLCSLSEMFGNQNWFNFDRSFYTAVIVVYDDTKVLQIMTCAVIPLALILCSFLKQ